MEWSPHFDCVFNHLGVPAQYKRRGDSIAHMIIVLCRSPENFYEVGTNEVIGQISELVFRVHDVQCPRMGDTIVVAGKIFKFHEEPLLDTSNLLWKVNAVLVGTENEWMN